MNETIKFYFRSCVTNVAIWNFK